MFSLIYNFLYFKQKEYNIKSQKNNYDCGYTVVSIVSNQNYDFICHKFPQYQKGTSVIGMQKMLEYFLGNEEITLNYVRKGRKKLSAYRKHKGIYLIRAKKESYGHWVILDKYSNLYDTEICEICNILDYDRKNDEVIAYFEF